MAFKFWSSAAALVFAAMAGPAQADGYGSIKDAPYVAPFSWTGFNAFATGGYAWGKGDHSVVTDSIGFLDDDFIPIDLDGFVIGGGVGWDFQSGNIVYGIAGDISHSDMSEFVNPDGDPTNDGYQTDINWFGTVRGRLGYTPQFSRPVLLYATGGLAFGEVEVTEGDLTNNAFTPGRTGTGSETRLGWTVGGGFETLLTERLVFGVEYLYVDLNSDQRMSFHEDENNGTQVVDVDAAFHLARAALKLKF